jgi:aryl-alcohol dehydrogenase-like predicted oxidoreductase
VDWNQQGTLGRTGLKVGRLGIGSSFGVSARAVEAAYDRGCNYLYWGSVRRSGFGKAIRNLCARDRDGVVFVVQSYTRFPSFLGTSLRHALRRCRTGHAEVLLLGLHSKLPSEAMLEAAIRLREKGLVRHIALSTHQRPFAGKLLGEDGPFDVLHVRYNASHRGAETEIFPHSRGTEGPGLVSFTATRWATLLHPVKGQPATLKVPTAADCYRFVMSRPEVDVCVHGPSNDDQLAHALTALDAGPMSEEEQASIRAFGDLVYGHPPKRLIPRLADKI